jgi:hypothetical protein
LQNSYDSRYTWKNEINNGYNPLTVEENTAPQTALTEIPVTNPNDNFYPAYEESFNPQANDLTAPAPYSDEGMARWRRDDNERFIPQVGDLPETLANPIYTAGYLATQIGQNMKVELLVGNDLTEKNGRLLDVGSGYIVLQTYDPLSTVMCDMDSIKFVTVDRSTTGCYPVME